MQPRVLSASTLRGDRVRNPDGEDLGHVEDLMIDLMSGAVTYIVLVDKATKKLFAVPWSAVDVDCDARCLVVDIDHERLDAASGMDANQWPDEAEESWQIVATSIDMAKSR